MTLGFSGDPSGPAGLLTGADTWNSTIVELLGLVDAPSLPRPLLPLDGDDRAAAARIMAALG